MERIESESFRALCPDFADVLVRREATKRLQTLGEVVGHQEGRQMCLQLIVAGVVVALDGGLFQGSVHPLDLSVRPGVMGLCQPMLDAVLPAHEVEHVGSPSCRRSGPVARQIAELDAVVGQDRMDLVRHGFDEGLEKVGGGMSVRPAVQLGIRKLRGAVDGDEEIELAFLGPNFRDVDMEKADRVGLERAALRLIAIDLRQAADPVTLQAAVQA